MTRSSKTKLGLAAALAVALVLPAAAAPRHVAQTQERYHALQDRGDAVNQQSFQAQDSNPITSPEQLYTY